MLSSLVRRAVNVAMSTSGSSAGPPEIVEFVPEDLPHTCNFIELFDQTRGCLHRFVDAEMENDVVGQETDHRGGVSPV